MNFKDIVTIGSMVLGVIIFIIVLFTEKKKRKRLQKEFAELKKSVQQDAIKTDIELRMKQLKETADSVIEDMNDNAEEKLNTLSNKKIMEFEEYANQTLEKIDINHKEVMFLYDMLNSKEESVKQTIAELQNFKNEATELLQREKETEENNVISKDSSVEDIDVVASKDDFAHLLKYCREYETEEKEDVVEEISLKHVLEEQEDEKRISNVFDKPKNNNSENSNNGNYQQRNEQIIKLYSLGYSTLEISKRLGIGTGEVALVNNLYHDRLVTVK